MHTGVGDVYGSPLNACSFGVMAYQVMNGGREGFTEFKKMETNEFPRSSEYPKHVVDIVQVPADCE